jgi:anti-sigma factor RsiW
MMMTCRKIQHQIQVYLDGAASPAEREQVDAHVARCEACARVLAESRELAGLLRGVPDCRVSADFERKLARSLSATAPKPAARAWWERFRVHNEWRLRVPATLAAGSLAGVLLVAAAGPRLVQLNEQQQERGRLVSGAVARHRELQRAEPRTNWDAVEASIDLSAGRVTD